MELSSGLENNNGYLGGIKKVLKSDITLFDSEGNIHNSIEIYSKDGKLYSKNGLFLPEKGVYGEEGYECFKFKTIDGLYLLEIGLSGCNMYFKENGEQYHKKPLNNKIIDTTKNIILGIIPYFK